MNLTGTATAQQSQQQFLQLLVAQVQNQNPLEPIKQEDFIQQLTQFSTLEGIEKLNANFTELLELQQLTEGVQLIGQDVRFQLDGAPSVGRVDEVSTVNGQIVLGIGPHQIPLTDVESIIGPS